jgi:chemotaxis protein CheD
MITTQQTNIIGLGELMITRDRTSTLACIGLGSCIALCAFDPVANVGGMAHMMLPDSKNSRDANGPAAKYVDTGTLALISRMVKQGADRSHLIIKIAGGARMLNIPGEYNHLDIGQRNIAEVKATLAREKLPLVGADVGGTFGRTVHLYLDSGRVVVKAVSGKIIEL